MARDRSVDWARGAATLLMIETHAVHAWASDLDKQGAAYAATRVVATTPLPAFMLLAGMSLRLRLGAAERGGQAPAPLRNSILRRGLAVVGWGYVASLLYALMDGHQGLKTILRADVLHVIGLSIASLALLCLPTSRPVQTLRATRAALLLTVVVTLLSPVYYMVASTPSGYGAYLLAPFVRVPGLTRFALLPMVAWASFGFVAGDLMVRARSRYSHRRIHLVTALCALLMALGCEAATRLMLGADGVLDYVHPAGIPNMTGYAARGLLVIALAPLLVSQLPVVAQAITTRMGQSSLLVYVFHIPFCYGALGRQLRGQLSMLECVPWVVALMALSYGALLLAEHAQRMGAIPWHRAWSRPR